MKDMKKLFLLQVLVIPLVMLIFKLPAEKRWLSLAANGVFWCIAVLTISARGSARKPIMLAGMQFLLLAVIPITILRVLSWNDDFNTAEIVGITGKQWHSLSNISFLVMMAVTLVMLFRERRKIIQ